MPPNPKNVDQISFSVPKKFILLLKFCLTVLFLPWYNKRVSKKKGLRQSMTELDYSLTTPAERTECVKKVIASTPKEKLTQRYLNYLGDYILFIREKGQTKGHNLITKNRETIIRKREKSYEDMINTLEGGEDALHTLINNDKNQLLDRKEKITEEEALNNPALQEKMKTIQSLKKSFETTTDSSKRFKLKQQIIET